MSTSASTAAQGVDSRQVAAELDISAKVSSDFEKAKVLLVDDSRLIRMGLRRSLVEIGLTDITEAGDGREAIETLVREHFDLMLLDMEMPEMNGMEVLAVLRDTPHHPWPPVIVISGGTSLEDAVRCIELGAEDYLSKPFNPVLLRARVKTSVERKRLRDQEALRMRQLKRQHEALASEQAKTEQLLLNILPRKIAQRLKAGEEHIADAFPNVSVLFADMVGFTAMSRTMTASALVEVLGDLFSRFDLITEKHGLEKIKTIGDCYMLAGGVPEPMDDHAHAVIDAAVEFCTALEEMRERTGGALRMRIGVHSGPIVAGVIGLRKFTYDLWGDTVNVASRMESTGEPGRIHVSVNTANLIRNDFQLESRGSIEVKSLGQVETFFVNGRN
ncbi:adenylate/guanylate cyclase domain-containing protein [Limnohabitans sp. Rim47]|jgi:adenylate cyclase|uniref:adenylate/guanylate cyclase domain-containing protein n=1 Tax=Limnohabitans sp. Rim47 TaxID=1100721 RepID=UPI0003095252|nr:adenylate/guanylate cyclase domain-containing protein [Limnohabitans sp. Rim47]